MLALASFAYLQDMATKHPLAFCAYVVEWFSTRRVSPERRHEVGRLINQLLGPPTHESEDPTSGEITAALCQRKVSKDDVVAMRWMAHRFESYDLLRAEHPGVSGWAAMKRLLVILAQRDRTQERLSKRPRQAVLNCHLDNCEKAYARSSQTLSKQATSAVRERLQALLDRVKTDEERAPPHTPTAVPAPDALEVAEVTVHPPTPAGGTTAPAPPGEPPAGSGQWPAGE
ncbi:MAG: hypothetical protein ACJ78Q_00100 [Chloroflexia bacterium]